MKEKDKPKDGDLITTTYPEGNTYTWVHNNLFDTPNTGCIKDLKVRIGMFDMITGKTIWMDDKDEK